jgi:hypothetical protein
MPTVYQYTTENLTIGDVYGGHDPNRYYLHEYFEKVPALNTAIESITQSNDATEQAVITFTNGYNQANKSFEISSGTCEFNTTSGISLTTQALNNSSVIVQPHSDARQTAWAAINWNTASQVHWSCAVSINSTSNVIFWAGLKLTNTKTLETDADQAYFTFDPTAKSGNSFTNTGNLHFVYSVAGTDYITDLGIVVAINTITIYKLRIEIDSNRQIQVYVNDVLYGLATTSDTTGTTALNSLVKSLALTNDINLKPYIGVETGDGVAKTLNLCYEHISKAIS